MPQPVDNSSIYPQANEGRLKMTDAPLPEEAKIISKNVEGSEEYEHFKHNVREAKSVQLDDKLAGRIVFCTIAITALAFADYLYGARFVPIISYFVKGAGTILIAFLLYYLICEIKISIDEHKYKKSKK